MRRFLEIQNEFSQLGVTTETVEFYNTPEFLRAEASNPALLESYAEYVVLNPYDDEYLNHGRRIIPLICNFLREELLLDGKVGACLDFVQTTTKILEQFDIWCMAMAGSLTVEFDAELEQRNRYWAHVFRAPEGHNAAGHAWLIAPPFKIIDMTIGRQPNTEGVQRFLPDFVISEETEPVAGVAIEDMLDSDLERAIRRDGFPVPTIQQLMNAQPGFARMMGKFRPFAVRSGQARLKYFPCAVGALEERFEATTTKCFRGQTAPQLLSKMMTQIGDQIRA